MSTRPRFILATIVLGGFLCNVAGAAPLTKAEMARFLAEKPTANTTGAILASIEEPCLPECRNGYDCNRICTPCEPPIFNSGVCEIDQGCYAYCTCICGRD
jgi:hypothetical protein